MNQKYGKQFQEFLSGGFARRFESLTRELASSVNKKAPQAVLTDSVNTLKTLFRGFKIFSLKNSLRRTLVSTATRLALHLLFFLNQKSLKLYLEFFLNSFAFISRMLKVSLRLFPSHDSHLGSLRLNVACTFTNQPQDQQSRVALRGFLAANDILYSLVDKQRHQLSIEVKVDRGCLERLLFVVSTSLDLFGKVRSELLFLGEHESGFRAKSPAPSVNPMNPANFSFLNSEIESVPYREKLAISLVKDQILSVMALPRLFDLFLSMGDYSRCLLLASRAPDRSLLKKLIIRVGFQLLYLEHLLKRSDPPRKYSQRQMLSVQNRISELICVLDRVALLEEQFQVSARSVFGNKNQIKLLILEVLAKISSK